MSKTVFDIKAGIQDYINTTNDDPHTIKQTIIKTLDFFNSVNYIHRYNCRSIAAPPGNGNHN